MNLHFKTKIFSLVAVLLIVSAVFLFFTDNNFLSGLRNIINNKAPSQKTLLCQPVPNQEIGRKPDIVQNKLTEEKLKNINSTLFKALSPNPASSDKNIQKLLADRKPLLVSIMRENPDLALGAILPPSQQKRFLEVAPGCAENQETHSGTLEVMISESNQGSPKTAYDYVLVTESGEKINLHPARKLKSKLVSGQRIKVSGYKLDSDLLFDAGEKDSLILTEQVSSNFFWERWLKPVLAAQSPDAVGPQRLVNIMVNFKNTSTPNITKEQINEITFNQMSNYFNEVSYGKVPSITGDTFGWYTLPMDETCDYYAVLNQAMQTANSDINFGNYNSVLVYAPFGPSCYWAGMSTIGKRTFTTPDGNVRMSVSWIRPYATNFQTIAHEFGHQLTLSHAGILNCGSVAITPNAPTGCSFYEYGDWFDVMGSSNGHVNAFHKEWGNWFEPGNVKTVTTSGTYSIEPIETKTGGVKTLKIPRAADDYLYIEYRQPSGFDAALRWTDVFNGALLHTLSESSIYSYLLTNYLPFKSAESFYAPQLNVGQTFVDPANNASVKVVSKTGSLLTVNINLSEPPDTIPPAVSITNPVSGSTVNGIISVSANASDNKGVAKVEFYDLYDNKLLTTVVSSPYSFSWDTTKVPNGIHTLYAIAYDGAGNNTYSANIPVTVNNYFDTTPPVTSITSPLNNAVLEKQVVITATATDDTGISKVEFYIDSALSGISTVSPYTYRWDTTLLTPGSTHTIFAKAYDPGGNVGTSTTVSVSIKVNDTIAPTVSITNPIDNGYVIPGTSVVISTTASDNVGVIKVEFYVNNNLLCTDTTAPYSCSWLVPASGFSSHLIKALAYDGSGNTGTVSVTAKIDQELPTVSITNPLDGSEIVPSANTPVTVAASDNVSIAKVEFFVDNVLLSTSTTPPYSIVWNTLSLVPGSSHQIYVKAYDTSGNFKTSAVINVKIKAEPTPTPIPTPPAVALIKPAPSSNLTGGSQVTMETQVTGSASIEQVDFYINFNKVCSANISPYSCNGLVPKDVSMYYLQAIAYYYAGSISTPIIYAYPAVSTPTPTPTPTITLTSTPTSTPIPPTPTPTPTTTSSTPTVRITYPLDKSYLPRFTPVVITVEASDPDGIQKVYFKVDGFFLCTSTSTTSTFTCKWSGINNNNLTHTIEAWTYNKSGKIGSHSITVYAK